jgi:hypothetical protein
MPNNYKSNIDIKVVQKFNSYFVQSRLCLHHANKAVPDVVYERNLIFFLKSLDTTQELWYLVSITRKQTTGVILGTQDSSGCGDSQLTCFKREMLTAGTGCLQKFRHTASCQLVLVYSSRNEVPRFEPLHLFHDIPLQPVLAT